VKLSDGFPLPTFPDITVGTIKPSTTASLTTCLPTIGTATFPENFKRGYYQSWNIFVQREFSPTLIAEVGYAGTHGVHIDQIVNDNAVAPNTGTAGRQLYPYLQIDLTVRTLWRHDLQRPAEPIKEAHWQFLHCRELPTGGSARKELICDILVVWLPANANEGGARTKPPFCRLWCG
jgi:hypothetical protein